MKKDPASTPLPRRNKQVKKQRTHNVGTGNFGTVEKGHKVSDAGKRAILHEQTKKQREKISQRWGN